MPSIEAEIDANFYRLIHKSVKSDPAEGRRGHARESFPSLHKVAPYDGVTLPQPPDFVDVRCHDLSRGGFSYLSAIRPASTNLIVAFGVIPDITCMEARIVRAIDVIENPSTGLLERIDDPAGEIGVPLVLVSCRFIRRLKDTEAVSST